MASPKPHASVSEELSEVQVLDSNEPLVTASSSAPSSSSARVLDSIEPLVPTTTQVQVLDSNEPLVLPCVRSSDLDEPVAGPSGMTGPSGAASSSEDEGAEIAAAMPRLTGSSGRRINPYSDELRSMWNWRKIFSKLGTHEQCLQFAEERGLIPVQKFCAYHRKLMVLTRGSGQVGKFRCRKSGCRTKTVSRAIGTWFENAHLSLTLIFQMMYAFSEGLSYNQTRKELACDDGPVISARTVADWFSYCRETITIYELENQRAQGKIGGPNKVVQIDESKFGKRKYNRGRYIEGHWVIGMIEDGNDDLRLEVCPDNERSADILVPLIKKHVQEGSIIHTDYWRAYLSLPEHGYIHKRVNHSDPTEKFVAPDGTHTQRIESQWRVPMTQVIAVSGEPVYLPCDISTQDDEDAVLLVLWYREDLGTPIYSVDARERDFGVAERWSDESVFASRAYFLPERRPAELGVDRVRATDQGVYRCRVDFKQAQTRNSRVNLTVIVPPSKMVIIDDKGDVKQAIVGPYIEGDTFTLKCDVSGGRPRPWVKWFRDEVETDTPASPLAGNGVRGVLRVGPLTRADVRAALTCRASNHPRAHPIETTLTLDMNFPPLTVHIVGSNQPLSASRRYDLLCQSSGSRPPASITWWKNGHRINNAKETLSTDGNTTTSTVSLQLSKSEAGAKLACRASNPQMPSVPALEDDWTLDIQYVPETTVRLGTNLDPTNIREGSDVYFDCIIQAHPYVYKVEWRHNGKTLLHNVGQGVIISNQSLVLQGVGRRTAGNYTCVGFNAEGDGESKPFSLDVLYAPTCRSSQQRVHGVAKQERAHITCHVDANPPEVIFRWTFNNTANSNEVSDTYVSRTGTSSTVTYTPHTEMDYGTLLCWAHNRIGKQRVPCVYHIIAAGRPDQVHNCTVVNASLTSFGVRCSEGFNGGMPQSFLLEVRDTVTQEIVANVSSAVPRFTAVGLQPGKTYAAAVLAYNAKGRGDPYPLRASTVRPPEKHHVHDKSLDMQRTAFQMSGAMSAAVGGGGVLMVVLVLFMIAIRQKCAKRKPRSAPPPSSQPASPDKLREKDDSESDDRNPDIIPSDTDQMQMDYYRQQQVSTISPPPGNRGPRGSVAGVRGGLPAYCALRTAPPPSHPLMHESTNATSGIPPPARFASGSCTLPRGSTIAAQTDGRCGIPLQHLRTLPRPLPAPAPAPAPRTTPRDTPL